MDRTEKDKLDDLLRIGAISESEYHQLLGLNELPYNAEAPSESNTLENNPTNQSTLSSAQGAQDFYPSIYQIPVVTEQPMKKNERKRGSVVGLLTLVNTLVLMIIASQLFLMPQSSQSPTFLTQSNLFTPPTNTGALIDKVKNAIFNVSCELQDGILSGTGWATELSTENGQKSTYIVTNYHVIEECFIEEVPIKAANEMYGDIKTSIYTAEGGYWEERGEGSSLRDLAVLRLETNQDIQALTIQKEAAEVGQWVMVIGYPGIDEYTSVRNHTSGLLSGFSDEQLIITDAAVNKGNSGGPMLNTNGEVLGTVFAANPADQFESMGFAQPLTFHCTIAFECMDGEILYTSDVPQVYTQLKVGDCLAPSVQGLYNLYDVSCDSSNVVYRITQEIDLAFIQEDGDLPPCAKDDTISEIVNGEMKIYCTL